MDEVINELTKLAGQRQFDKRSDGYWFDIPHLDVIEMAQMMLKNRVRLCTMTAIEREDGETDIIYHYIGGKSAFNIRVTSQGQTLTSLANLLPGAAWIEREIHDLYAVNFDGHPDLRPLVRPKELPVGFYRKSVSADIKKGSEAK